MNSKEVVEVSEFAEHARWLEASILKARHAAELLRGNSSIQVKAGDVEMLFFHPIHRQILTTAFTELAAELAGDLESMEATLEQPNHA